MSDQTHLQQACPRCGAGLRTKQVNNLLSKYCDRCGSLHHATNVKTGKGVFVDRSGLPIAGADQC